LTDFLLNQFSGLVHREDKVRSSNSAVSISVSPLCTTQHLDNKQQQPHVHREQGQTSITRENESSGFFKAPLSQLI